MAAERPEGTVVGSAAGPTTRRLAVAVGAGTLAGIATGLTAPWQAAPLVGWATAAVAWSLWTWAIVLRLDAAETAERATREDPHGPTRDVLLITAAVVSLIAVVLGVVKAAGVHGAQEVLLLTAGVASIIASWGLVHTDLHPALRRSLLHRRRTAASTSTRTTSRPTPISPIWRSRSA